MIACVLRIHVKVSDVSALAFADQRVGTGELRTGSMKGLGGFIIGYGLEAENSTA